MDDKAQMAISDKELLSQFQKVSQMPNERKMIVKELIDFQKDSRLFSFN